MRVRSKIVVAGCAVAVALGAVAPGVATAASGPKGKTVCTTLSGSVAGNISITGCTDINGANTGGGTVPGPSAALAAGGTFTWISGKTSTMGVPTTSPTNAKKCPGYVKFKNSDPLPHPVEPTAFKVSGVITADNSGMKVPGKLKGSICLAPDGTITALKAFKIS